VFIGNPKGRLQEVAQRRWKQEPRYELVSDEGPPHARRFTCRVVLPDGRQAVGEDRNKQSAEARAAESMLKDLDRSGQVDP